MMVGYNNPIMISRNSQNTPQKTLVFMATGQPEYE